MRELANKTIKVLLALSNIFSKQKKPKAFNLMNN
jgi:hypothetical protein